MRELIREEERYGFETIELFLTTQRNFQTKATLTNDSLLMTQ